MTNSYNSPKLPRLIILHGLNNNGACFNSWEDEFKRLGYEVKRVVLPGHGDDRKNAKNLETALNHFDDEMKKVTDVPYVVIAFSYGGLFLELWLNLKNGKRPLKKVFLAPGFYIKRFKFVKKLLEKFPSNLPIPSIAPRPYRRYFWLYVWEYRTLFEGFEKYQELPGKFIDPTMLIIDPKDEVVDAMKIIKETEGRNHGFKVTRIERKRFLTVGAHHMLFLPKYFVGNTWVELIQKTNQFLKQ